MRENSLRLYTKIFIIILALLVFSPFYKISAHNATSSPWLYINSQAITEDDENPTPNPSKLKWGEHYLTQQFNPGDTLEVQVDKNVIVRDLEVKESSIIEHFDLTLPDNSVKTFKDNFSESLSSTGNYFLDVKVSKNTGEELILESVMFIVGNKIEQSKFKVNGTEIDITSAAPTFLLNNDFNLVFEVINPENNKYNYQWDLGTSQIKEGDRVEYNFETAKIPIYVVLRTTDKSTDIFIDSFVRIDSDSENVFKIPAPPVKVPDDPARSSNVFTPLVLILGGIAGLGIILLIWFLIIKKRD
ncbi:MAG: hypothetical protein ABI721_03220 [Candidatus Dojkabacteria bacterium]